MSPTRASPLSVCSVRPIETHTQTDIRTKDALFPRQHTARHTLPRQSNNGNQIAPRPVSDVYTHTFTCIKQRPCTNRGTRTMTHMHQQYIHTHAWARVRTTVDWPCTNHMLYVAYGLTLWYILHCVRAKHREHVCSLPNIGGGARTGRAR